MRGYLYFAGLVVSVASRHAVLARVRLLCVILRTATTTKITTVLLYADTLLTSTTLLLVYC